MKTLNYSSSATERKARPDKINYWAIVLASVFLSVIFTISPRTTALLVLPFYAALLLVWVATGRARAWFLCAGGIFAIASLLPVDVDFEHFSLSNAPRILPYVGVGFMGDRRPENQTDAQRTVYVSESCLGGRSNAPKWMLVWDGDGKPKSGV